MLEGHFTFEEFTLDPGDERLSGPDGPIHVGNKALRVLEALIDAEGQLLTKDALFDKVWTGVIVSDSALTSVIKELRRALGDDIRQPRFIESVYGRGYRFIAQTRRTVPRPVQQHQVSGNLPLAPSRLIGRDGDVARVRELLQAPGVVTLVGSGGVGKSHLAVEVANLEAAAREDGGWMVELAALTDPGAIPEAIATSLRVELPPAGDAARLLTERLRLRNCLIVFDNCEHLLAVSAQLADAIVRAAPRITLLCTSQEPLGIAGERVHRLAPLDEERAVELFTERATALDAGYDAEAEITDIMAVCRKLDGLPLALEMAAARAPSIGCAAILERLDDRFRMLTAGQRTALPRHQTLLAALEWSHALLPERDAVVLRRLAVFAGQFNLEAAAAVAADDDASEADVEEAVADLVAKSLVVVRGRGGARRYALLETVRAFARRKLEDAGEVQERRRRLAQWCLRLAEPIWTMFTSPIDDATLVGRYECELGNIMSAIDWAYGEGGDVELGHALLVRSASLWSDRPLQRQLDLALPRVTAQTAPEIRARLLSSRAHVLMMLEPAAAIPVAHEAVAAIRETSDNLWALCDVLCALGFALWSSGRIAEARAVADEIRQLVPAGEPSRIGAFGAGLDACVTVRERGPAAARPIFRAMVADLRSIGAVGHANFWQATALQLDPSGDIDQDIANWRELLAMVKPGDMYSDTVGSIVAMRLVSCLASRARPEDIDEAIAVARRSFRTGAVAFDYRMLLPMARLALLHGDAADAARLYGHADILRQQNGETAVTGDEFEALRTALEDALGAEDALREIRRGALLSTEAAISLALGEEAANM